MGAADVNKNKLVNIPECVSQGIGPYGMYRSDKSGLVDSHFSRNNYRK